MNYQKIKELLIENNLPVNEFTEEDIKILLTKVHNSNLTISQLIDLINILEKTYDKDQNIKNMKIPQNINSNEYQKIMQEMKRIDDENLVVITQIIDKYGFIDNSILTAKAGWILFGALQHADHM